MPNTARILALSGLIVASATVGSVASASPPIEQSVSSLPSTNGYGAILLDLSQARLTQFREHIYSAEEPRLDSNGMQIWTGNQPLAIPTRDLLFDTYFGIRTNNQQYWLTQLPVDLSATGYSSYSPSKSLGTSIVTLTQTSGPLLLTQYYFCPQGFEHSGFVMLMKVTNQGAAPLPASAAFSIHNFHLGYGRPGPSQDIAANGETLIFDGSNGHNDFLERAFAGVIVTRSLSPISHHGGNYSGAAANVFDVVNNGTIVDLPDLNGAAPTTDDSVSAFQYVLPALATGETTWVGLISAHHGDPFAGATVQGWLDTFVANRSAEQIYLDEVAYWQNFQANLTLPTGLTETEEALTRHSAVMLHTAQVSESETFVRPYFDSDSTPRFTAFSTTENGPPATLPNTVLHRGKGAVLASLPPGEWTIAWSRDSAYSAYAMAQLGMYNESKNALLYLLNAQGGRFENWMELSDYSMPPYQISLTRYYGFGVEETDFNDFGPNLEFDGFGLSLWALRQYEISSGDTSLVDDKWNEISTKIADPIVALVDPASGLLYPDSSIWESHWNGRQRAWTYTNITAVRGLCDAAALAERLGDAARADLYRTTAQSIRQNIAEKLVDTNGVLASNREELESGSGYMDTAVVEAITMGLFDPNGPIATSTLSAFDNLLRVSAGPGYSRNDDRTDHPSSTDSSPWGSEYDSAEWAVTDLRASSAIRLKNDSVRAAEIEDWVKNQSLANFGLVSETYDELTGQYKFNAPMIGFGAAAWAMTMFSRQAGATDPACGAYYDENSQGGAGGMGGSGGIAGTGGMAGTAASAGTAGAGNSGTAGASGIGGTGANGGTSSGGNSGNATGANGGTAGDGGSAGAGNSTAGAASGQSGSGGQNNGTGAQSGTANVGQSSGSAENDTGCGCKLEANRSNHAGAIGISSIAISALLARRKRPLKQNGRRPLRDTK